MSSLFKKFLTPNATPSGTPEASPPSSRASTPGTPKPFVRKLPDAKSLDVLKQADVPYITLADCQGCDALDEDEEPCRGYPKSFSVDLDSDLLGSIKGYGRLVVIGTGKQDWEHDVTSSTKTLAGALEKAYQGAETVPASRSTAQPDYGLHDVYKGPAESGPSKRPNLKILNGSHVAPSDDDQKQSLLVFPDWKAITLVGPSDAPALVSTHLSPAHAPLSYPSFPSSPFRSRPLPYRAVILLCSHRRRDKRCHIAAPLLAESLSSSLHKHDIHVDDRGELLNVEGDEAAEDWTGEDRDQRWREHIEKASRGEEQEGENGAVGIFRVSHVGGHKFSGNVVIQFPNGVSVWYGRVAPSDCAAIVEKTILGGQLIVDLLRGGVGISNAASRPCGILSW